MGSARSPFRFKMSPVYLTTMASYTYKCDACDYEFETEHSIKAPKGADCPKCSAHTTNRLISCSNFHLVGNGWAKDLYSKD
jgi:putative FmdB family regulatory protein